jgi:Asp-tRNA(Asn)/Glu-tRNA(Gln) amidotransferase A subunit family amidase
LPALEGWDNLDLSDLTLGVFWPWFRHATQDMVDGCEEMLGYFESLGAKIIEVEIPDLEMGRVAHLVTIAGEIAQVMDEYHAEHGKEHGLGIRINLRLARAFTAQDYVKAQRVRTRLMLNFNKALEIADVIVTPAAGLPAPQIKPKALPLGDSDLSVTTELMRFAPPANMTGLPAIVFPVGYNKIGLPLSMQVMGKAWDERTLLRMALAAEQKVVRQAPPWHYDILGGD